MNLRILHGIAHLLRKVRLLQGADYILYLKALRKNATDNKKFVTSHDNFPVPPAHLAYDAYGHVNYKAYFESGTLHAGIIGDIINKNIEANSIRVLEWGCGPGRVIRHLKSSLKHSNVELYGADYNAESIKWCQHSIKDIYFSHNQMQPPFLYKNDYFDCVYAISVFTHLSEVSHFEWIKEISRVLKPNGLIILTTHGDLSIDRLLSYERRAYDSGYLVVRGNVKEGKKWYLAYHPKEFIVNKLLKDFHPISHDRFSETQDVWVARKI